MRRQYEDLRFHLPDALIEADLATQRIVYLNRMATILLGYDAADVEAGLPGMALLAPESQALVLSVIATLAGPSIANRTPYDRTTRQDLVEARMIRKDGTVFHAEVQGSFVLDHDEIPHALRFLIRNIDTRKLSEERLRAAYELNRSVLDSVTNAIATIDPDGTIRTVNRRAVDLFEHDTQALVGARLQSLFAPHGAAALETMLATVTNSGVTVTGQELIVTTASGATVITRASVSPLTDSGRVTGLVFTAEDVTEQRRTEEVMQHAQRLESLGILAGGVAHDFNNLLVGIVGNVGIARMDPVLGPTAREAIDEIEQASRRAADLARQMLAYAGKVRLEAVEIDLVELAEDTVRMVRHSMSDQLTIRRGWPPEPVVITGDPTQLRQVVMNLVINACEAIGEQPGEVWVNVANRMVPARELRRAAGTTGLEPGSYTVLEVIDTGAGMDEQTRRRIFEPFYTTKFTGRGLGLAAVLGIVKGHGGAISVDSTPGQGTTFRVYFRRQPAPQ